MDNFGGIRNSIILQWDKSVFTWFLTVLACQSLLKGMGFQVVFEM